MRRPLLIMVIAAAVILLAFARAPLSEFRDRLESDPPVVEPPGIGEQEPSAEEQDGDEPLQPDVIIGTGTYKGRIDNDFIEISVDGKTKAFLAPEERISELLYEGDDVTFDYYENTRGQLVIVDIKYLPPVWQKP